MAVTWTVTPSEGVTNNNDGTFVFPSNTTYCSREYTITYTDTDKGCQCQTKMYQYGISCESTKTYGSGDAGNVNTDCSQGYVSFGAYVPYTAITRTVSSDCTQCLESTSTGSEYKTGQYYVNRNCSSSIVTYDVEDNDVSAHIIQGTGCTYEGKCPINNCSGGDSCTEGAGCDGHMYISPEGSSYSTPYGQDSFAISSSSMDIDTSGPISYSVQSTTGGAHGYGYYRISFTGTEAEWNNYSVGDTVGYYTIKNTPSGYCGHGSSFTIAVKKST